MTRNAGPILAQHKAEGDCEPLPPGGGDLRGALEAIQRRARSDGNRTFDDAIRDLGLIDDLCRAALTEEQQQGHRSDCAMHNAPAMPAGPCDCGAAGIAEPSIARPWKSSPSPENRNDRGNQDE